MNEARFDRAHRGPIHVPCGIARLLIALTLAALPAHAGTSEVITVAPWELHSSFWVSLHQTLMADAMRDTPRETTGLSNDERAAWDASVVAYRAAGGRGDAAFARPMMATSDALSQVPDDTAEPDIDAPLADALKKAAPVYRRHWWTSDDRANRFVMAYAAAMLREAGAELLARHAAVYRTTFPKRLLVYFSPHAGRFGGYTFRGRAGGWIVTMSSRRADYQGHHVVEMLLHESSHAVVGPTSGTIAAAIAAASKKHGVAAPRDLWHAILFSTSSELTRRALADRGVSSFVPSSEDLFTRAWPTWRAAIETHWLPYLNDSGTLEDAIDRVVAGLPRER